MRKIDRSLKLATLLMLVSFLFLSFSVWFGQTCIIIALIAAIIALVFLLKSSYWNEEKNE